MRAGAIVTGTLLGLLAAVAAAQGTRSIQQHGNISVVEVPSAELPSLLQQVKSKISGGAGDKWAMPVEVLTENVVLAEEITLIRGRRLILAPKSADGSNLVLFIAKTIKVEGVANQPVQIIWNRSPTGSREPVKFNKASNGVTGEREGADGKAGTDGVTGNRGFAGQDAPSIVFIARKFEVAGPVRFEMSGQDGSAGGPGQDGGDGGPGRPGRAGTLVISSIGFLVKGGTPCEPAIRGGNGGPGGSSGSGGAGGRGGDAGNIGLVAYEITADTVLSFVDARSELAPGKGGQRGALGLRGKGGTKGNGATAQAPCEPSLEGTDGPPGVRGRVEGSPAIPDVGSAAAPGDSGTVVFSRLSDSQARSIGLLPPEKPPAD